MKTTRFLLCGLGFAWVMAHGAWTSVLHAQPGSLDVTFNALVTTGHWGYSVAVQPDGKVIAAGSFGVVRLLSDGSVDPAFQLLSSAVEPPLWAGRKVAAVALQPDGKVLVSGNFTNASGAPLPGVMRLNADGSIDPTFHLDSRVQFGERRLLALQPDGKAVLNGYYSRGGGDSGSLVRLLPDGSLDPEWDARWYNTEIYALAVASDGRIYLGVYNGVTRVNPDGSLDESFNADLGSGPWGGLALQLDGKVVAGGYTDGDDFHPMRRLLDDSSSDPGWNAPNISGGDGVVYAILLQPDGRVLFGGNNVFTPDTYAALGRLKVDGTVDTTFDARSDLHFYNVEDIALAPDGKVVVAGYHLEWPDLPLSPGIWRLNNDSGMQPTLEITRSPAQGMTLGLRGPAGATFRLEYRETLGSIGSWTALTNLTLSGGSVTWTDTGWTNSTSRYYRAVSLP
jgi:uncharacterized delta-60 repeat protein